MIRLVLALMLTLVVMRQASNPDIYRPFFGNTGVQPSLKTTRPVSTETIAESAASHPSDVHSKKTFPTELQIKQARRIAGTLSDRQRNRLTKWLAWGRGPNQTEPKVKFPSSDPDGDRELLLAIQSGCQAVGASSVESGGLGMSQAGGPEEVWFRGLPQEVRAILESLPLPTGDGGQTLEILQAGLDLIYQQRVVDGALWSDGDAEAFYRYLERSVDTLYKSAVSDKTAPRSWRAIRVGVVPLMQQPEVYLGKTVWLSGRVARAVRRKGALNSFGVTDYWELWIRPDDGSEHPVILYTLEVAEKNAAMGADASLDDGPAVAAVGVFLKRRVFSSAGGVLSAPVLVGQALQPSQPKTLVRQTEQDYPVFWLVLLAAILGVSLAIWITWRASVSAKHSRSLRRIDRQLPDALIQELTDSSMPADSSIRPDHAPDPETKDT